MEREKWPPLLKGVIARQQSKDSLSILLLLTAQWIPVNFKDAVTTALVTVRLSSDRSSRSVLTYRVIKTVDEGQRRIVMVGGRSAVNVRGEVRGHS